MPTAGNLVPNTASFNSLAPPSASVKCGAEFLKNVGLEVAAGR